MKKWIFSTGLFLSAAATAYSQLIKPLSEIPQFGRIVFEENLGQIHDEENRQHPEILFVAKTRSASYYLSADKLSCVLESIDMPDLESFLNDEQKESEGNLMMHRVDIEFNNSNDKVVIEKLQKTPGVKNYYYGFSRSEKVCSYDQLRYKNIYEEIDVVYHSSASGSLKYDFVIHPKGNPDDINFKYKGADAVEIVNGHLMLSTSLGEIEEFMPKVYQIINEKMVNVKASYNKMQDGSVGFTIATYNPNYDLIIDPWITYFGGNGIDYSAGITKDIFGNVGFTGTTTSSIFPSTVGAFQGSFGGANFDGYAGKMDANGNLIWATYCGGGQADESSGVAFDASGNLFVCGKTYSSNFPVGATAAQTLYQSVFTGATGVNDAFLIKLNSSNGSMIWSTYYGGSKDDYSCDVVCDANGDAIMVGRASSTTGIATIGSYQTSLNGTNADIFISKFSSTGSLMWGTYVGGAISDVGCAVDVDGAGNIYFAGHSNSSNYPVTTGVTQTSYGGGTDAVVGKMDASGKVLIWSTFLGGAKAEHGYDIDVDNVGNVFVSGETFSSSNIATSGTFKPTYTGSLEDGFVVKYNSSGVLQWGTYIGGTGKDYSTGVAVDTYGNVVTTGDTYSANFPISCSQSKFYPVEDQFFVTLDVNTGSLICSGTMGLSNNSPWHNETFAGGGSVVIDGHYAYLFATSTGAYPVTSGAYQTITKGSCDVVIAKLCVTSCGPRKMNISFSAKTDVCVGEPVTFTQQNIPCDTFNTSYVWTFSGATPATSTNKNPSGIKYNAAGTYGVKLVIKTPCGDDSLEYFNYINVKQLSMSLLSSKMPLCYGGSDGNAVVQLTGGTSPYSYTWFPSGGSNGIGTGLSAGTYSVNVIDNIGCISSLTVSIAQPTKMLATIPAQNNVLCFGSSTGSLFAGAIGGSAPYTYLWSNGASTQSVSNLSANTYSVIISDKNGCSASTSAAITEPSKINLTVSTTDAICALSATGTASVNVVGGTAPYSFLWSTSPVQTLSVASGLIAGSYTVISSDANSCTSVSIINIAEPPPITGTITTTDVLCNGTATGSMSVFAAGGVGGYNYLWKNGATTNIVSSLVAGVYMVTINDANGCTGICSDTVNEPAALLLSFNNTDAHCNQNDGSSIANVSGGTPGYNYQWSNLNTGLSNSNIAAGIYSVTITDGNSCVISGTTSIANLNGVVAGVPSSIDAYCNGICDGSATAIYSGGSGPYIYNWSNGQTTINATGLCAGNFSVTITDANGCWDIASITIMQPAAINSVLTTTDVYCNNGNNGSINVVSTMGGTSPYNYYWSTNATGSAITGLTAGNYSVTISDGNGCTKLFASAITEPSPLIVNTSSNIVCPGASTTLSAFASGSTPGYIYTWSTGQLGSAININPTTSGIYSLTVSDAKGCTSIATSSVTIYDLPDIKFTADQLNGCGPLCVTLINTTKNIASMNWNFSDTISSISGNYAYHCFNTFGQYDVSLTVVDSNGCKNSLTINDYITVHPNPVASFAVSSEVVGISDPAIQLINLSTGATGWNWLFIPYGDSREKNPSVTFDDTGTYAIKLFVINEFGCKSNTTKLVRVMDDYLVFIPNAFTPNHDNKNDVFLPIARGVEVEKYEMNIYDRWGNQIFISNNLSVGWDGTIMENPVQQDVYVWKIKLKDFNGAWHSYTGHVTLLR